MPSDWNPELYLQFAEERARPFRDLLSRIEIAEPRSVVDLGCGPGNLTALLAQRWPGAEVKGIDSSPAMIAAAQRDQAETGITFEVNDLRTWAIGSETADVVISNATLHWVPGHRELFSELVASVRPGGAIAFGIPANFAEPSHQILRTLAAEEPYVFRTRGVAQPDAYDAVTYLADLSRLGCRVDAWETTYLHVLRGPDPVYTWLSATAARSILAALDDPHRLQFEAELKVRLAEAYPVGERVAGAVVLPFRRTFVVAHTGS